MKRISMLFLCTIIILFQQSVKAVDSNEIDWNNLVENKNVVNTDLSKDKTAYNSIPGNLESIYEDINQSHWAYQAVKELSQKYNILVGLPDKNFHGDKTATRYELAQALAKLINTVEEKNIQLSAMEKAALNSLRKELEKEIMTLAARVEINTQNISNLEKTQEADVEKLTSEIDKIKERSYFTPEIRMRYNWGDPDAFTDARLRLTSKSYLTDKTYAEFRLEARTGNLINNSEWKNDIADADLTLAYVETGDLTKWIPQKYGRVNFIGGLIHANRLFIRGYRTAVDQRGFSDTIMAVSIFNSQNLALSYENADGRSMSIGGEYVKKFNKYNGMIRAGALRSTGGSIDIPGTDISSSGKEMTFYCVMGKVDLPVKDQPVELKVSHSYSFNDAHTNLRNWSAGGRLATKFENFGVVKAAIIGNGGTTPVRLINGTGGHGVSYQLAYNPTIKAFGKLFGDPDKVTYDVYNYEPGKTEIGVAFGNYHNDQDIDLRVLDVFASRYFSNNIWGVLRYTHANPNTRSFGLSALNSLELMTVFKF
ncbi:MAG: S-layer homology domain-containing protein [Cyanobacteriota bacterium]